MTSSDVDEQILEVALAAHFIRQSVYDALARDACAAADRSALCIAGSRDAEFHFGAARGILHSLLALRGVTTWHVALYQECLLRYVQRRRAEHIAAGRVDGAEEPAAVLRQRSNVGHALAVAFRALEAEPDDGTRRDAAQGVLDALLRQFAELYPESVPSASTYSVWKKP